ncbi:class I SAM-dependent methyltransferase [Flavobacteriaceae bacterium]|nr:class I SAM-dependent methyltransferase [Flavobacteriaceae bacterium]MDB2413866.1 class I SAM-dependent methyltransferase [Flavobacteriaceae bacterium]
MNERILHQDVQEYITNHLKSDLHKLILKGIPFNGVTIQEIANQILCKQKSEKKLPSWFNAKNIYYPPKVSIEQTSSETAANYKASLVSGKRLLDLTGGFGVDSFYFSSSFNTIDHCEIDTNLSKIAAHNFEQLNKKNIICLAENGLEYLKKSTEIFDVIYIDPSRRNDVKEKVFLLKDCEPNIPKYIDLLLNKTTTILIKNSPILDITSAIKELKFVKEIHIVAIRNDVKELLYLLEKEYNGEIKINTINFSKKNTQKFNFVFNEKSISSYQEPLDYLYEPNAAILKSGGFHEITAQLDVYKIHQHSHLYTSKKRIEFPGREFKIIAVLPYDKKQILKLLPNKKANITIRNFHKTVAQIRKELKIKDGGDIFLFFTTNIHNKFICMYCKKL